MSDVRIITPKERDAGTAQTPGMVRLAGVAPSTCGSSGIWMGEVMSEPAFRSGAHHHAEVESAIYVVSGIFRIRWGDHLEHSADAQPGDFIFVPPHVVHQEINGSFSEPVVAIVGRSGDNVVVNVDVPEADKE